MDPIARQMWRRLAPRLQGLGLLTEVDLEMFAALCRSWARYRGAQQRLSETIQGAVAEESALVGLQRIRKAEISVSSAEASFRALAREFGLSPASRNHLDVALTLDEEGDFEELLSRGRKRS